MRTGWRISLGRFVSQVLVGAAIAASPGLVRSQTSEARLGIAVLLSTAIATPTPSLAPGGENPRRFEIQMSSSDRSFHGVADALARAATSRLAAASLFEFEAGLGDYAGDAKAQRELRDYEANARFLLSGNNLKYVAARWLLPDSVLDHSPAM